jgi:hypothetical protein
MLSERKQTQRPILYDSIYVKLSEKNKSVELESRSVAAGTGGRSRIETV